MKNLIKSSLFLSIALLGVSTSNLNASLSESQINRFKCNIIQRKIDQAHQQLDALQTPHQYITAQHEQDIATLQNQINSMKQQYSTMGCERRVGRATPGSTPRTPTGIPLPG